MNTPKIIQHLFFLIFFSIGVTAQSTVNSSLNGRITDANGASVAGAIVTLINSETNSN